ncbi:MAG TPA: NAD(P)H-hydrate dehydratase [Candidatus Hydrogenedentes bacterium]|jgi:NAD(P)H-hydrate epimerase|nr:NAD(P)H-hydrate dehydratase [Candidatus Hydrogenedentota bacterium]MDY0032864.1 NAD(P)H-hydrate dehydratase [FCB group bacterium]NLT60617.1 NAD(P)H-hydrate dehydratase [Candidatus Hydrogenedentota bacterium]HNZ18656.1 NAD(P)H-hydrate dehydratase [Candidatus Hydrogenedentota bacterium]HOH34045.1 NAD(P)H-hydrate dehydratase [Candidatus Hydrogenedentota bacterium]
MLVEITKTLAAEKLPERPRGGHKGTFGHVFVVGGSLGFTGAVQLAGLGAARSGSGLVTLGVPESLMTIVGGRALECMTFPLAESSARSLAAQGVDAALEFAATRDACVLGPGCSQHPDTREFTLKFIRRCPVPLVVDADGLNNLSTNMAVLKQTESPVVLTPHPGEMARLTGQLTPEIQADRAGMAARFAAEYGCTVVLKGAGTIVAAPGLDTHLNTTGNDGMGTGGTGDVLSGVIGGLIAQGLDGADAALLGVYAHGLAGDIAAERRGRRGMLAGDLVEALPEAWLALEQELST